MDSNAISFVALSLISMCGTSSNAPQEEPTATGFSCSDYQLMMTAELSVGQACTLDSDCQQILSGTGCGCESDDLVANNSYNASYFYEFYDEAHAQGCDIDFNTTCDCDAAAEPVCLSGTCGWN